MAFLVGAAITAIAGMAVAQSPPVDAGQGYPASHVRVITGGPGTMVDIITRQLAQRLTERWAQSVVVENRGGAGLTIVQYKGGNAAMMAVLSGEAHAGFNTLPVSLPHVRSGKVKAYAVTSPKRFAGAPDIPTAAEAGLTDFETQFWVAMMAPARTPAKIIDKINRDVVETLRAPVLRDALIAHGAEPAPGTPEEFTAFLKAETLKWGRVVRTAGIKPE